jgi:hypothetical protein
MGKATEARVRWTQRRPAKLSLQIEMAGLQAGKWSVVTPAPAMPFDIVHAIV